jgi:preprotein translocase SecE subunit
MNSLIPTLIWGGVVAAIFAFLWWKGYIARLNVYFQETWHELKPGRCSWPTWTELRGSTVLIAITIALLGVFVTILDLVFNNFFTKVL